MADRSVEMRRIARIFSWGLHEPGADSAAAATAMRARAYALLLATGGALVLITLSFPNTTGRVTVGLVVPAVGSLVAAVVIAVRRDHCSARLLDWMTPLATALISVVVASAGAASVPAYATLYSLVVVCSAWFQRPRLIVLNLVFIAAAYAGVLALTHDAGSAQVDWLLAVTALALLAVVILGLRSRADGLVDGLRLQSAQREKISSLMERVLDGVEVSVIMDACVEALAEGLRIERAAIVAPAAGELRFRACAGWPIGTIGGVFKTPEGSLSLQAPIPGHDNVLIAIAAPPHRFTRSDGVYTEAVAGVVASAMDRANADAELRRRAYYDHLTGLPNRALTIERLERALHRAATTAGQIAVLQLDIDNFRVVNDSLGYQAGDALLSELPARVRPQLGLTDTIARFGGDELVVLCSDVESPTHACEVAQRVLDSLREPFVIDGNDYRISASVGLAVSDGSDGADAKTLLRDADTAMYRAKAAGRGSYELFTDAMHDRAVLRLRLERALRGALERRELTLVHQPIVSMRSGEIVACEALLRWTDRELGTISPAEFVPLAEETGLIVELGRWVLRQACSDAAMWARAGRPIAVGVNVSPRQLAEPDFANDVATALAEARLDARYLTIEITEGVLLEESDHTLGQLRSLRDMGVHLSLDDFGTGYSSLAYLHRFPLGTLKIDRAFVSGLGPQGDATLVQAIVAMAHALGMGTVAEGVETLEQLERLTQLGCTLAQGFYPARPMPANDVPSFGVQALLQHAA
jgi:diguanylate cyclase (GGDEF)-like protein